MKIILNSITFAPLVQKLQNDKHAHHLIKDISMVSKVEWGAPRFGRVTSWSCMSSHQKLLDDTKSRATGLRGVWEGYIVIMHIASLKTFQW
jgi:hypothetical protein